MFGCLFNEEDNDGQSDTKTRKALLENSRPRCDVDDLSSSRLVGISNQGATCYLNSVIQTLFLTPEFRDSILAISPHELGNYEDANARIIILELQMLFAEMLLLDRAVVSTSRLTDSFGWSDTEGLVQNDVQELNRILFSAIEHSLEGTSAANLINDLYKGTTVNQIRCKECGYTSEREETYLDLTVAVRGYSDLGDSLTDSYLNTETLSGSNQYKCQMCDKLVSAEKGARMRNLPPILTFCLLRLTYDYERGQRKKETSKYNFPMQLSMSAYTEDSSDLEDDYELFSVLVHRGGAGGGHYHALIRDIDCLGNWTDPKPSREASQRLQGKSDSVSEIPRVFEGPDHLLESILQKYSGSIHLEKLRQSIIQETCQTWNKGYKKYGSITKFLKTHSDKYAFDEQSQMVMLVSSTELTAPSAEEKSDSSEKEAASPQQVHPPPHSSHWFSFDDRRVSAVNSAEIERYFGGKECAYMLFYRRKSLVRPTQALSNNLHCVPAHLIRAVKAENTRLEEEREAKLRELNTVKIHVYLQSQYKYQDQFVCAKTGHIFESVSIDQRLTISDLLCQVITQLSENDADGTDLYLVKPLNDGYLHLISCLSDSTNQESKISSLGISSSMGLLLTSKASLERHGVVCGLQNEPILIHVDYDGDNSSIRVDKSVALDRFHSTLLHHLSSEQPLYIYHNHKKTLTLLPSDEQQTVGDVLCDKSSLVVSQNPICVDNYRNSLRLRIIYSTKDKFTENTQSVKSVVTIVDKTKTVSDLAQTVCAEYERQQSVELSAHSLRLRPMVNDEAMAPLYNDMVINQCSLNPDQSLQVEIAEPVSTGEIVLYFLHSSDAEVCSIKCRVTNSVQQVISIMRKAIPIEEVSSSDYYLQTTDYFGSPNEVLYDKARTLAQLRIRHGETLYLTEGTPPPKDLVTFSVYIPLSTDPSYEGYLSRVMQSLHISEDNASQTQKYQSYQIGVSAATTVQELKQIILSKAERSQHDPSCTRLRHFHDWLPSKILKGPNKSLREYKVKDQTSLLLELLECPEALSDSHVVLQLVEFDKEGGMTSPNELIWDTQLGSSAKHLRIAVRSHIKADSTYEFLLAKYRPSSFDWKRINQPQTPGKGSAKKKKNSNQNLCKAPNTIQDGDMIGCFPATEKTNWDGDLYQTDQDKDFKTKYLALKRQQREARKDMGDNLFMVDTNDSGTERKPVKERAITIKVGDFTKKTSNS